MQFFTSLLILLVCITLSLFLLNKVEEELLRQIHLRGMSTITNFAQNAKYSLTTRDKTFLASLVEHEISKEDVVHVIVVNERAVILGHNNPSKVGQIVDDEYTQNFLESLDRKTVRKITIPTGEVVYDFVMPILDTDIYTDDRYADPIEARSRIMVPKNLGLIRIGISFRKNGRKHQRDILWSTLHFVFHSNLYNIISILVRENISKTINRNDTNCIKTSLGLSR